MESKDLHRFDWQIAKATETRLSPRCPRFLHMKYLWLCQRVFTDPLAVLWQVEPGNIIFSSILSFSLFLEKNKLIS